MLLGVVGGGDPVEGVSVLRERKCTQQRNA